MTDRKAIRLAEQKIKRLRPLLGIDPRWKISVEFVDGDFDGKTIAQSQLWRAWIEISPDFLDGPNEAHDLDHVLLHEMLELLSYETMDIFWAIVETSDDAMSAALGEIYKAARNRFIETLIPILKPLLQGSTT